MKEVSQGREGYLGFASLPRTQTDLGQDWWRQHRVPGSKGNEYGCLERIGAGWAVVSPGKKQLTNHTALGKGLWLGEQSGSFSGLSKIKLYIHCWDVSIFS